MFNEVFKGLPRRVQAATGTATYRPEFGNWRSLSATAGSPLPLGDLIDYAAQLKYRLALPFLLRDVEYRHVRLYQDAWDRIYERPTLVDNYGSSVWDTRTYEYFGQDRPVDYAPSPQMIDQYYEVRPVYLFGAGASVTFR